MYIKSWDFWLFVFFNTFLIPEGENRDEPGTGQSNRQTETQASEDSKMKKSVTK